MFHTRRLTLLFALLLMLAVGSVKAQDLTDTTFFLTYVPNVQFAPIYVGLEKGYFEDAGFNITIEHGDEPVGMDLIAANERQFGIISGEQVIAARAQDRPVVFVYEWYQQFPVGIAVTNLAGVQNVTDLKGQRVGIAGRFGASYSGLIALLSANGMTEQDIQLEEIGFNAPEVVCVGAINAVVVYVNNEPLQIQARADAGDCSDVTGVTVFPLSDYVDLVSNGLVTNEQMIAEHPDQVRAMVEAFDRSLHDTIANPTEAYLLASQYVENLIPSDEFRAALETAAADQAAFLEANPDADFAALAERSAALHASLMEQFSADDLLQLDVLLTTIPLWEGDHLGETNADSWQATEDTLLTMGFLEAPITLEDAYTNDFVPQ